MKKDSSNSQTPLMKQFWELKKEAGDALLLFRMGDFYELFGPDAEIAADILKITLTSRDKNKPNPVPMAGVPHHSAESYIQKLLAAGKKVAIGEQVEDPATAKGIVKREIVRTFSPAVRFDLSNDESTFLSTFVATRQKKGEAGQGVLACVDVSTGEVRVGQAKSSKDSSHDVATLPIKHFLDFESHTPAGFQETVKAQDETVLVESLPENYLTVNTARKLLKDVWKLDSLENFLPMPEQVLAVGALVRYSLRSQKIEKSEHFRLPVPLHQTHRVSLGSNTAQHLDLIPDTSDPQKKNLFGLINLTRSSLGARRLKNWMQQPLKQVSQIQRRQAAIRELAEAPELLEKISRLLDSVYDLERIVARVHAKLAKPADVFRLGTSLAIAEELIEHLKKIQAKQIAEGLPVLEQKVKDCKELTQYITEHMKDPPPAIASDGGVFARSVSKELSRLIDLSENGEKWLIDFETKEKEKTGINSLKVRYNRVFGYYIEVTKKFSEQVPDHYQRKQSMVNAERFFTEELKKFEDEIMSSTTKQKNLESELFASLLNRVRSHTEAIKAVSSFYSEVDALHALAKVAQQSGWNFPKIDQSMDLHIEAGRHPMVDSEYKGEFVPNSVTMESKDRRTLIITGPNMGGKSTIMRQVAIIVILGQMGSAVPAAQARWGYFSSVFTRIGAQDAIARGQSTFMVEMSELAHILHHSDSRSLIILDEIGRGTSTYDGMSVAWATVEWVSKKIKARTLFATHYHELTQLEDELDSVYNAHMGVESSRKSGETELRFLYQLLPGAANESFGIQVAKLAGLPQPLIRRSWEVLDHLEESSVDSQPKTDPNQLSLFESSAPASVQQKIDPHPVLIELEETEINDLTPLEALNLLSRLRTEIRSHDASKPASSES